MPKYSDIFIDSSLFALAKRGSGKAQQTVLQHVIDHLESGLPMPDDLQKALIEILTKLIPKIANDRGFHEKGFEAWENAQSVHEVLVIGAARSLEDAFDQVAQQILAESGRRVSEETIKKHWNQFGPYAKQGEIPPLELLGDLSPVRQGKEK